MSEREQREQREQKIELIQKVVRIVIMSIVFILGVALVIVGQKNVGAQGLLVMLLGLAILIALLWFYNRRFK